MVRASLTAFLDYAGGSAANGCGAQRKDQQVNSTELRQALKAQDQAGRLQPGDSGWWPVWGAKAHDVQAGDALLIKGEADWLFITDTFTAKAHPVRVGLIADGERFTLGALVPVAVFRQGTHNHLA